MATRQGKQHQGKRYEVSDHGRRDEMARRADARIETARLGQGVQARERGAGTNPHRRGAALSSWRAPSLGSRDRIGTTAPAKSLRDGIDEDLAPDLTFS